jgi:hypothetical protein
MSNKRCPVCESLSREYDLMCELETTLILRERHKLIHSPIEAPSDADGESRDLVLLSRKRQAKIFSTLDSHRALAHSA